MSRVVSLVVLVFIAILVLPTFNNLWGELADILIATFNVTTDSPTGVTFYLWATGMPYVLIAIVVFLAFKIIRGHDTPEEP